MALLPLNDSIIGQAIEHDGNSELRQELAELTDAFGLETTGAARTLDASLAPQKQPFQVLVEAIGPDVQEIEVGDVAILPQGGGTMVTVMDEETGQFERIFTISERAVLLRWTEDD